MRECRSAEVLPELSGWTVRTLLAGSLARERTEITVSRMDVRLSVTPVGEFGYICMACRMGRKKPAGESGVPGYLAT